MLKKTLLIGSPTVATVLHPIENRYRQGDTSSQYTCAPTEFRRQQFYKFEEPTIQVFDELTPADKEVVAKAQVKRQRKAAKAT